jgi:phthalate 4,5-cis-dihydrodiol dehydrogenase
VAVPLRIGIAGLGAAGRVLVPALEKSAVAVFAAVAEPDQAMRETLAGTNVQAFASIEEMLDKGKVDGVYVATPTFMHADHVVQIAEAGRHVLVEKPMAIALADSQRMIRAAERAGVVLMVGHSHAYDPPIRKMRELIDSGRWGKVRMLHSLTYTDWMYRPRRPDELQVEHGGGVTFRQGAHQFDILRLLGGGLVESVRASTGNWDPARQGIGAHTAFLQFADGVAATAVYSGYGAFSTAEVTFGIGEGGSVEPPELLGRARRAFKSAPPADELAAKRGRGPGRPVSASPHESFFGLHIVSCEGADLRQSPNGIYIYDETGRSEVPIEGKHDGRDVMLADFVAAIRGQRPARHSGAWGQATLETTLAVLKSAAEGREVPLSLQVPVPG